MAVPDEVRDPKRDDARLPRSRTREYQERSVTMQHRFTLFGIELFEEVHGGSSLYLRVRCSLFAVRRSLFAVRGFASLASGGSLFASRVTRRSDEQKQQREPWAVQGRRQR